VGGVKPWWVPSVDFLKGALLTFAGKTAEGQLVAAVGSAWRRILKALAQHPEEFLRMAPRDFEQFIAGCYDRDGYTVTLTPASGDLGRDVIAEKPSVGTIRILDQVKRFKPGHLVTADDVRAFLFVAREDRATKCFITTTSDFAPLLVSDRLIAPYIESAFLELRSRERTIAWLRELEEKI
jgi:restriction system protein